MKHFRHLHPGSDADRTTAGSTSARPRRAVSSARGLALLLVLGCGFLQPLSAAADTAGAAGTAGAEGDLRLEPAVLVSSMQIAPLAAEPGPVAVPVTLTASGVVARAGASSSGSRSPERASAGVRAGPGSISEAGLAALLIAALLVLAGLNGRKRPLRTVRSAAG